MTFESLKAFLRLSGSDRVPGCRTGVGKRPSPVRGHIDTVKSSSLRPAELSVPGLSSMLFYLTWSGAVMARLNLSLGRPRLWWCAAENWRQTSALPSNGQTNL